ncbi:MAG: insulinase family protein [Pseudonocardiaceae bacterium]|nr:insulinase family protein [Pseudonocardiaceae bacterium]
MTTTAAGHDARPAHRSAEQIGTTPAGPRPLPPLGTRRTARVPSTVDTVLENGLRVIAVRRPAVPMVELRLAVPFGGTHRTHAARAEVLSATLLRGTARRDRFGIDTELARVGGELSAGVDPEYLSVSGSALASGLPVLLDVLADSLSDAAHRAGEVARERSRLVERIVMGRSQPRVIAREALQRHRYGDHPATREMPAADDVAAVTPAAVRALHRRAVVPGGSVLVLVGDITPARVVETVAAALSGWRSDRVATEVAPLPDVAGGDLALVHRDGAVQSQLRLSGQALPRTDERYPALQLANLVFGGYFSSRWVENIREDKGYTYGAHSGFEFTPHGATLLADADTASEVTAAALLETRYELGRMAVVPPDESEVDNARQYSTGSLTIGTSSQAGLAGHLTALAMVGLDVDWLRAHPARLRKVTTEQVAEAAAQFLAPTRFTGVVVGDAERLAGPLSALGGVAVP